MSADPGRSAREPEEILEETRKEGRRRLTRPLLETAATALVGGFDVALGVAAYGLADGALASRFGSDVGRLAGALAFGVGFVFVVVGRSELFTENILVPIVGLDRRDRRQYAKLLELWLTALVVNVAGGALLATILTVHGVLGAPAAAAIDRVARHAATATAGTAFWSAVVAGALMTLMTWLVEGAAESMAVRIVTGWIVGSLIALGMFNHAVVSQIELVFGLRGDAGVAVSSFFSNLGLSVAGNLVGGLGLVTFVRLVQASSSR